MRRSRSLDMHAKNHVTIVVQHVGSIGGMERQVTELCTGYLEAGWHVTVISRACDLEAHQRLTWIPVRGPYRPFVLGYPWFIVRAGLALRRHRDGVVHVNGALVPNRVDVATVHFSHLGFRRAAPRRRGSRSTALHQLNALVGAWQARLAERWCYRPCHIPSLVAISEGVGDEARREYGYPADAVTVIPYGVDAARFARDQGARAKVRKELLKGTDELIVLFVGGDWERKGLTTLVEALVTAPGWRLVVVGDGDSDAVAARALELGTCSRVSFLGRREVPTDIYSAADAFCLPTSYETFCLVAHEAAAAGLPLLVTRVHGVDVLLQHGTNGWFITREPADIAARLNLLRRAPDLRQRMGAAAAEASQGYSWAKAVRDHLALYRRLEQANATPPPASGQTSRIKSNR
jgi:UDP-glucose:(heptosyl)LPS alpha-1,3-glucosyltransferase